MTTMQAVVHTQYGSPEVLKLTEMTKPAPKDNEVLIKIRATTVTAVDAIFRSGSLFSARLYTGLTKPKMQILGSELAGDIEAVGKDVKRFKVGDPVFALTTSFAAHAEYVCLPAEELVLKPPSMSYAEAAAIPGGITTALPFLREWGRLQPGQQVLVNGASGSIGTYAVQLAKQLGAEVTGVCSRKNVDLVKSLGADHVIDYRQEDFTQTGRTYDIIFDTVGKSSFTHCKEALKPHGIYLTIEAKPASLLHMWTSKFGSKKAYVGFAGLRPVPDKLNDIRFALELFEAGKLKPIIDRCYPLEQIAEAHEYVDTGHKKGNVVITVVA